MSRLLITVDTDNEAFRQNGWRREAAEVLYLLVAQLTETRECDDGGLLRDTDGTDCGAWDYQPDEP